MRYRLSILTIALAFVFTHLIGIKPSHAAPLYYYLWDNIHSTGCTNSTFSFWSNDYYITPSAGDVAHLTERIAIEGGSTTMITSADFTPYWAAHPGAATIGGTGIFWASNYYMPAYSVPSGVAYTIYVQLLYRGVPGGSQSSSYLAFKCSGDNTRHMTLLNIDNMKIWSNL